MKESPIDVRIASGIRHIFLKQHDLRGVAKYSNNYRVIVRYLRAEWQRSVSHGCSIASMITSVSCGFPVDSCPGREDGGHVPTRSVGPL